MPSIISARKAGCTVNARIAGSPHFSRDDTGLKSWQSPHAMRLSCSGKQGRDVSIERLSLIAIVDDDQWSRDGLNCYLESCGYDCAAFCTAEDYLSADAVCETACLVADVQLPGIWGPELQDRLIADGYCIPTIFITGYFDDRIRSRVLDAGAIAYLTKPWSERTLGECLEKVFGARRFADRPGTAGLQSTQASEDAPPPNPLPTRKH